MKRKKKTKKKTKKNYTHQIYIACYTNRKRDFAKLSGSGRNMIRLQEGVTGSNLAHIAIGMELETYSDIIVCYDVTMATMRKDNYGIPVKNQDGDCIWDGGHVEKKKKSWKCYDTKFRMGVTQEEFTSIVNEAERLIREKAPFNVISFYWNFIPFLRWFPLRGKGYTCAHFVAHLMQNSGILRLDGYVLTDGYLNSCCCCCPWFDSESEKPKKLVKVPSAHQIPVAMLYDLIYRHAEKNGRGPVTLGRNLNIYAEKNSSDKPKRKVGGEVVIDFGMNNLKKDI